jgi:hypothetical protein
MARYPTVKEGTWAPDSRDSRLALGAQSQTGIFGEKNIVILLSGLEPRLGFVELTFNPDVLILLLLYFL